ncbi:MAG: NADH peroxidase [Nitrospinae bacterium]|nr:NADH peroxidase [Nitrospinota bacterium]
MKKWKCSVCGYMHTGEAAPETCPVCYASREKFVEAAGEKRVMDLAGYLEANIKGETWEVTHYMAMALKAQTLGMGEVAEALYRIAQEEAYHGANFIQRGSKINDLKSKLDAGNQIADDLKKDMEQMLAGERGAHKGKNEAASLAKAQGLDELSGFFRIAAEDEARHAKILDGLLKRHFK